jgi:hypothetical protein
MGYGVIAAVLLLLLVLSARRKRQPPHISAHKTGPVSNELDIIDPHVNVDTIAPTSEHPAMPAAERDSDQTVDLAELKLPDDNEGIL